MQRGPREREARYLQSTLQLPDDLIYIQHLLAHVVSNLDTRSPTISSRWHAATTTGQQNIIQTLDNYSSGVRCGKWREIFRKERLIRITQGCVFSFNNPPEK